MSVELVLGRFDPENETHDRVSIPQLANLLRSVMRDYQCDEEAVFVPETGGTIQIELPGGTAEVHADHALFPIQELDPVTTRVAFEVAKAANFVVITEGGKYSAILTDIAQRALLPKEWQNPDLSPVSQSVEH